MRIIAITGQFRPLIGGTEVQAARLAGEWAARGHHVEIWTRRLEADHPREEREGGAWVRRLGWASRARVFRMPRLEKIQFSLVLLARLVARKNAYDVVIVQQALYPAVVAALASWLAEQPLVVRVASTGVTSDFESWGVLTNPVLGLFRHATRALIVMNRQGVSEARSLGFSPDRIHRIPNGLEPGGSPPPRARTRPPRVAYVGAFRTEKRVDLLLRAWSLAGAPGELLLAGDGSLRVSLETLAGQLNIAPVFLGNVTDPRLLLRDADIFVLASDAEGMSNALLEAMAEGCACLATFVGGNVDCLAPEDHAAPGPGEIVKGSAGWLVGCGDEKAMAAALKTLCCDADLRDTLGQAARAKILADHSLEQTANEYLGIFESLHEESSEPGSRH